jgi:predicted nucleic acid-binding protein
MASRQVFVDTNILVYAHDRDAADKHLRAKEKVAYLWRLPVSPAISVQVLQELYVNLVRKDVSSEEARQTVIDYGAWHVVDNDRDLLVEGIDLRDRWQCSFWDALILAAAKRAQAGVIWSEDFSTAQNYDGIVAVNPLAETT